MKQCPNCENTYTDETLQYCLQDGTPLVNKPKEKDEIPMVIPLEQETVISSRKPEQATVELNYSQAENPAVYTEPQKSNNLVIVLLTALITLVLLGFAGIGAYYYMNGKDSRIAGNPGVNKNKNSFENIQNPAENTVSETPKTEKTPKPTPKETDEKPTPEIDLEAIKQGISSRIFSWKSQAEAINLGGYMDNYADQIDYYRKNGASKNFVRNDKQKAFNKYDSMKVNLSNISITASKDGQTASVVFDKEWKFSGAEDNSSGKVRQQLKLKKSGETWLITSEKDLKVY